MCLPQAQGQVDGVENSPFISSQGSLLNWMGYTEVHRSLQIELEHVCVPRNSTPPSHVELAQGVWHPGAQFSLPKELDQESISPRVLQNVWVTKRQALHPELHLSLPREVGQVSISSGSST